MSIREILKERKEMRAAFQNLKQTIKEARPDGISLEEAGAIADAAAEWVTELAELINVAQEDKQKLIQAIKALMRPR